MNKDDDSLIDDHELETMFIDDDENLGEKKKKSNTKQNQVMFEIYVFISRDHRNLTEKFFVTF